MGFMGLQEGLGPTKTYNYKDLQYGQKNGPISQNGEYRQHCVHCFGAIRLIPPVSGYWAMILAILRSRYLQASRNGNRDLQDQITVKRLMVHMGGCHNYGPFLVCRGPSRGILDQLSLIRILLVLIWWYLDSKLVLDGP